jgi:hypothetical protein
VASLTSRLGFADDFAGFAIAQNQGIAGYLWNGLGLLEINEPGPAVTQPDFLGPVLDLLVVTPNEIWRELVQS